MSEIIKMSPSRAALDLIQEFEQGPQGGMASVPYRDFAGHWTIGWGHKIKTHERFTSPLSEMQAADILRNDMKRFAAGVNQRAKFFHRGNHIDQFFAFLGGQFISSRCAAYGMTMNALQIAGICHFPDGMAGIADAAHAQRAVGDGDRGKTVTDEPFRKAPPAV